MNKKEGKKSNNKIISISLSIILITIIMMDIVYSTINPHIGPGITEEIQNRNKVEFIHEN